MFPEAPVPNVKTIYNYITTFQATGSILDGKRTRRLRMTTFGAKLETSPSKLMPQLAQQVGTSAVSVQNVKYPNCGSQPL